MTNSIESLQIRLHIVNKSQQGRWGWLGKFSYNIRIIKKVKNTGRKAVSSKDGDKMRISPTKNHNPNNTIRAAVAMIFTPKWHMFSPELIAEQSLARVLLLNTNSEKCLAVKLWSQLLSRVLLLTAKNETFLGAKLNCLFHLNLFFILSLWFLIKESQDALRLHRERKCLDQLKMYRIQI